MNSPLLLALETSSRRGSVALGRPDDTPKTCVLRTDRTHTAELLPAIAELLAAHGASPHDVQVIAYSRGPGSFTGLRVGATVARTWHSATGVPVVAIDTLDALARPAARRAGRAARLAIGVAAGGRRVFGAIFALPAQSPTGAPESGPLVRCVPAALRDGAAWLASLPVGSLAAGDWVAAQHDALVAAGVTPAPADAWLPDAADVWALAHAAAAAGQFCPPDQILPLYPRPPECEEVYEQRRAAARAARGV